jgi:hypothetical protein
MMPRTPFKPSARYSASVASGKLFAAATAGQFHERPLGHPKRRPDDHFTKRSRNVREDMHTRNRAAAWWYPQ